MSDNQPHEFGNRHHGRFPRVSVTIEDDARPAPDHFGVVICPHQFGYEHPGYTRYLLLSRDELVRLVDAGRQALAYRPPTAPRRSSQANRAIAAGASLVGSLLWLFGETGGVYRAHRRGGRKRIFAARRTASILWCFLKFRARHRRDIGRERCGNAQSYRGPLRCMPPTHGPSPMPD
jgi:hypothetical protein